MSLTTAELMERTGVTFRQLDHWCRKGWLTPAMNGREREWDRTEAHVAMLMARLVSAGFRTDKAATVARETVRAHMAVNGSTDGAVRVRIAKGVTLRLTGI